MARYKVFQLDGDLSTIGELTRIRSITIDRSITDKVSMLESCSVQIDCDAIPPAGWYRIERHSGNGRDALGTFWLDVESTSMDRGIITASLTGRSVLAPAADESVKAGAYAKAGQDAPRVVADLLGGCPVRAEWDGNAPLKAAIVYGDKASKLEAAWMVLDAANWRIRLDGYGRIFLEPMPKDVSVIITEETRGVLPGISIQGGNATYKREYDGEARPGDLIEVHMPRYGTVMSGRLLSQSMDASAALISSEKIGEADERNQ